MCVLKEMRNHGEKVVVQGQVDIRANNIGTEKREYRRNRQHLRATCTRDLWQDRDQYQEC